MQNLYALGIENKGYIDVDVKMKTVLDGLMLDLIIDRVVLSMNSKLKDVSIFPSDLEAKQAIMDIKICEKENKLDFNGEKFDINLLQVYCLEPQKLN